MLASVGKAVLGQVPNPHGAIGDDQDQPGQTQAAGQRLAVELGARSLTPQARGGITALGNDRAVARSPAPVVQAKDRRHVNPVPGVRFFARFP